MNPATPKFSRTTYAFDQNLTDDLRFKRENGLFESPPLSKKSFAIVGIILLGMIATGIPSVIIFAFAVLALFILAIIQINREGDSIIASCPTCAGEMAKEERANLEYFICHQCKIYALGRDSQ